MLGAKFIVYMDHRTLENFATQPLLSRRQARWQEFLAQCDFEIRYVKGKDNAVADALSRLPAEEEVVLSITADENLLAEIWAGYVVDTFTKKVDDPWGINASLTVSGRTTVHRKSADPASHSLAARTLLPACAR